jgi:hypothetical protein
MKTRIVHLVAFTIVLLGLDAVLNAQQPFSNVQSSPTTSPYLNLTGRNGASSGFAAYQNLVLPQLQQQQTNLQQQQQIQHLQQQQQKSLVGGLPGEPQRGISTAIRGTGHVTAFMDYLHYYPRPGGFAQAPRQ